MLEKGGATPGARDCMAAPPSPTVRPLAGGTSVVIASEAGLNKRLT
jgi:hypothetical protein